MFSRQQKREIAAAVEQILLSINHPEMLGEKPMWRLHVEGAESWSWADIEPNWLFDDGLKEAGVNPHNELNSERKAAE